MARDKRFSIFPVVIGSAGETKTIRFNNGSYEYFGNVINWSYENSLIDNVGDGQVRISLKPGLNMTTPVDGAKTLKSGDALSITETIHAISIYFIEDSVVEMILISD